MNKYIKHKIIHFDDYPTHVYELIIDNVSVGSIEQRIPNLPQSKKGAIYRQITYLNVKEQFQGKGFGRELVEFFEKKARDQGESWIEVNSSKSAETFYQHMGFVKTPSGIFGKLLRKIGIDSQFYKAI